MKPLFRSWLPLVLVLSLVLAGCSAFTRDSDGDGIADAEEGRIVGIFMPVFEFDEDEHNILAEHSGFEEFRDVIFLHQLSPVECSLDGSSPVIDQGGADLLLTVVAVYGYDYAPVHPLNTIENDTFAHYGDTERVRLCLQRAGEGNDYEVSFVLINRHGEEHAYRAGQLARDEDGERIYLYVSEGKHATFVSGDECEQAISGLEALGWNEDCSGGPVILPAAGGLNVGEYQVGQRIDAEDLGETRVGDLFAGEAVWSPEAGNPSHRDAHFCGGHAPSDYAATRSVAPFYESPVCGGSLHSKWYQPSP